MTIRRQLTAGGDDARDVRSTAEGTIVRVSRVGPMRYGSIRHNTLRNGAILTEHSTAEWTAQTQHSALATAPATAQHQHGSSTRCSCMCWRVVYMPKGMERTVLYLSHYTLQYTLQYTLHRTCLRRCCAPAAMHVSHIQSSDGAQRGRSFGAGQRGQGAISWSRRDGEGADVPADTFHKPSS